MALIMTAILAVGSAWAVNGVTKASEQLLVDAYSKLQELLEKNSVQKVKLSKP